MKKLLIAAGAVSAAAYAAAAEIHATAKVVAVDKLTQTVTFRDSKGETTKIQVPPEVQNLDRIEPGSVLHVRYVQAAAVAIGRPGVAPAVLEEFVVVPAAAAPGDEAARTRFVVARVEDIDLAKRELKVKGPDDETITLYVVPGVSGFEDAKVGAIAPMRFTAALALVVTPAFLSAR